jgi:hypothetical protein
MTGILTFSGLARSCQAGIERTRDQDAAKAADIEQ